MFLRVLPVMSSKSSDLFFEVWDEVGHCTLFERDELTNLRRPAAAKVIYGNYEISPDEERDLIRQGREAAAEYASTLRLL